LICGFVVLGAFGTGSAARADDQVANVAERVYINWCGHCHNPGSGHPGTQRLEWSLGADKSVLKKRTDLDADYIKHVVRNGLREMPSLRPTEVSNAELDALAEYLSRPE